MTAPSKPSDERPSASRAQADDTERRPGPILTAALSIEVLAAVALVVGTLLPVVDGAVPGFGSRPLLVVLAVLPLVVGAAFVLTRRHAAVAGLLMGLAVIAPGRLLLDLQFLTDSSTATRPELYLPTVLVNTGAGAGLWALLAGHVLTIIAGLVAARFARAQTESVGGQVPERRRWLLFSSFAAVVAGVGLLMAPMGSDDSNLVARGAFEGSLLVLGGCLVLAFGLLLAVVMAMGSPVDGIARGTLLGLVAGLLAVVVPDLAAGWSVPALHVAPGPIAVVVAAVALAGVAFLGAGESVDEGETEEDLAGEARVPGLFWWQLTTGVLAVLTAGAAFAGGLLAQVTAVSGLPVPQSPARPVLMIAGGLVGVLGLLVVLPVTSRLVRPVLSAAWVGVLLSGAAVLGTALVATRIAADYSAGPGVIFTCVAMLGASLTAGCSVITGVVERDTDDETDEAVEAVESFEGITKPPAPAEFDLAAMAGSSLLMPLVVAAILAVGAFGLPTFTAPDYVSPGLWSNFETSSWGLVAALATVLGAAALALGSRSFAAAGLLVGAAAVIALRAAELPFVGGSVAGSTVGIGFWLALACVLALLFAAGLAVAGGRRRTRRLPRKA
ncbi:MAG: hypothetical protein JWQ81_4247 [Amycolatopsis sp.]|jgi:hypothetical protein|uniref:hypothetical protein n=1 Tax=Amycolatopsis sp. TaxID=37632 RepID=UPI0026315D3E|nr:hypothetical protein [Amycolatopsis sp.]MCU1683508.1 hypothetical protein [Amycolatopsis sp.]